MIPQWFLWLQGFAMLIMGVGLLRLRPRPRGASFFVRYVNAGTIWALCCCAVGVALLALAAGWWTWPPRSLITPRPSTDRPATTTKR